MESPGAELHRREFEDELGSIARWWLDHAFDADHGGVYGEIADDNTVRADADKGAILQARVLWFLSELAQVLPEPRVYEAAHAQCRYLIERFVDARHGGVVWSVTPDGAWRSDRKQVYVQAFAIYAFSAFARAFGDGETLERAVELSRLLDERAWDHRHGGYVEALGRDWRAIDDVRLSERDLNAPKTMNTHLHVLEACTALHRAARNGRTAQMLAKNVELFLARFVRPGGRHLALFYSMDWQDLCSGDQSHGHDIEASWLLWEAAEVLGDPAWRQRSHTAAVSLATESLEALDRDGGLAYERCGGKRVAERHWWPQAEALVGFYNAYELTGDVRFRTAAARVWTFVNAHQIDRDHGEWRWLSAADHPARGPYKAGFWKGPYHNGRAMIEMLRRLTGESDRDERSPRESR